MSCNHVCTIQWILILSTSKTRLLSAAAPSTAKRRNYKEDSDSGLSESDEEDRQDLFTVDDDPTIVDNPGQSHKSYWVLNQRDKWSGHFTGSTRLPQDAAKHLARRYCLQYIATFNTLPLDASMFWSDLKGIAIA